MEMKKIIGLLEYLGYEEVDEITITDDETIEIDGEKYLVLSDDEADKYFEDCQRGLFDEMGLQSYSESFQCWIKENALDKDYFDDIVREDFENYIEDIKYDGEDRLLEEMENAGVETEEEFLEYLIDNAGDSIEYVTDNFGNDYLDTLLNHNPWIIDLDVIIEEIKSWDGRGTLANYDCEEMDLDNDYYAYRMK